MKKRKTIGFFKDFFFKKKKGGGEKNQANDNRPSFWSWKNMEK